MSLYIFNFFPFSVLGCGSSLAGVCLRATATDLLPVGRAPWDDSPLGHFLFREFLAKFGTVCDAVLAWEQFKKRSEMGPSLGPKSFF